MTPQPRLQTRGLCGECRTKIGFRNLSPVLLQHGRCASGQSSCCFCRSALDLAPVSSERRLSLGLLRRLLPSGNLASRCPGSDGKALVARARTQRLVTSPRHIVVLLTSRSGLGKTAAKSARLSCSLAGRRTRHSQTRSVFWMSTCRSNRRLLAPSATLLPVNSGQSQGEAAVLPVGLATGLYATRPPRLSMLRAPPQDKQAAGEPPSRSIRCHDTTRVA